MRNGLLMLETWPVEPCRRICWNRPVKTKGSAYAPARPSKGEPFVSQPSQMEAIRERAWVRLIFSASARCCGDFFPWPFTRSGSWAVVPWPRHSCRRCQPNLRTSRDVDVVPIGTPVLYYDGQIIERELGGRQSVCGRQSVLRGLRHARPFSANTPPGWQERVTIHRARARLARSLSSMPHDIAYNKLWAGRTKDIAWVRGIIEAGVARLQRLLELHETNPIPADDHAKVSRSLDLVTRQPT
jgi:hypothetical protein